MRLAIFAVAATMIASTHVAQAQDALAANGPIRVAAIGQTRVVMVQGTATDEFVWEWTFLDEDVAGDQEGQTLDTLAISVMYDCAARTRRALVLEAYRDGAFVFQTPLYEEPMLVTPGTLVDGALDVVCAPEANSDGAVFPDLAAARSAIDGRSGAERPGPPAE